MIDRGSFPGPPSLVVNKERVTGWFFGGRATYFECTKCVWFVVLRMMDIPRRNLLVFYVFAGSLSVLLMGS